MSDIIEYKPANVVSVEPGEVSTKTIDMVRTDKFLDEETRKLLLSKPSILSRIAPSPRDRRIQEFQTEITDIVCQFLIRDFRENLNDRLLRHAATLRADTVNYCRLKQAEVEDNLSVHLRRLAASICDDITFCHTLPDKFVRDEYEKTIRENFHAMLMEYRRTNNYFNEFLDTQIKGSKLFDQ